MTLVAIARAALIASLGALFAIFASKGARRLLASMAAPEQVALAGRVILYGTLFLALAAAMREVGFDLTVLLGAAGILTVAIGFASQTSASNVISGVFLVFEKPFGVGDMVEIDGVQGTVMSVDLLSVTLRTFDNLAVRVPNETVMKGRITNFTRYPIRRYDLILRVEHDTDLKQLEELLVEVAQRNPVALEEPAPLVLPRTFNDAGLEVQFSTWAVKERFLELRTSILRDTLRALRDAGVRIPYPQRSLVGGPVSVRLLDRE